MPKRIDFLYCLDESEETAENAEEEIERFPEKLDVELCKKRSDDVID